MTVTLVIINAKILNNFHDDDQKISPVMGFERFPLLVAQCAHTSRGEPLDRIH
jgi:hypothetical protein